MTDAPIRLGVLGATGRTGRVVVERAMQAEGFTVVAAVASGPAKHGDIAITHTGPGCFADAEVIVDFSTPAAVVKALPFMGKAALVTGTTGLGPDELAALVDHSHMAPLLTAANFSTGVSLLLDLVERAARALPDYDVEVIEAHHRNKVDAPSGTALALARAAARGHDTDLSGNAVYGRSGYTGVREPGAIGIHAVRMGDVVGDHQVWLAGPGERVSLGHVATSRDTFAMGALRAARWVYTQPPGRYDMRHVLGLDG